MASAQRESGLIRALRARTAEASAPLEATLVGKPRLGLDAALQRVDELLAAAAAAGAAVITSSGQGSSAAPATPAAEPGPRGAASVPSARKGGAGRAAAAHARLASGSAAAASLEASENMSRAEADTLAALIAPGSKQHLSALRIVRVKLLAERAAAAALAGSDTAACRQQVLSLLLAAQAEATAALSAGLPVSSTMLLALTAGLAALTAGCSGGALDACLSSWQAFMAASEWGSGGLQLSSPYEDVSTGQHPRAVWPLDLPSGWGAKAPLAEFALETERVATELMQRAVLATALAEAGEAQRLSAGGAAGRQAAQAQAQVQQQPGGSPQQDQQAGQPSAAQHDSRVRHMATQAKLFSRLSDQWVARHSGTGRRHSSGLLLPSAHQAAGEPPTAAAADAEPQPFEDNERDRSLLQRFGVQPWLRAELRRQLAGRYPLPPGSPLQAEVGTPHRMGANPFLCAVPGGVASKQVHA